MSAAIAEAPLPDVLRALPIRARARCRTIWLSDLHLGTQGCEAEVLLGFLAHATAERIYLVGDIVDLWRLRARPYWPQAHDDIISHLLRLAREGTKVLYLPGNHDDAFVGASGRASGT